MSFRRRPAPFQSHQIQKVVNYFRWLSVFFFWDKIEFLCQTVNFCLEHVIHIRKAINLTVHLKYLGKKIRASRGVTFLLTQWDWYENLRLISKSPLLPIYIFGIVLQFLIDWQKRIFWIFFRLGLH